MFKMDVDILSENPHLDPTSLSNEVISSPFNYKKILDTSG